MTKDITTLTTSELAEEYNKAAEQLGESQVKRFSDKKAALRRTQAILDRLPKRKRKPRGMRFVFKPDAEIRECKGTARTSTADKRTLRQRCVDLLHTETGATFKQVENMVATFDKERGREPSDAERLERRTYELIRIMHYYLGYGIRQSEDGRIAIYTE